MLYSEKYSPFGKILAKIALANNLDSQEKLRQPLGLSSTKMHGLLLGKVKPTPEIVDDIKEKLTITQEDYDQLKLEGIRAKGWSI